MYRVEPVESLQMTSPDSTQDGEARGLPLLGWLTLAVTAVLSAVWSAQKLLEQDEIFSLQTDRVSSLAEVFRIQRFYPISLEPPAYHVLAHAAMAVFGPTAFALRLPAFLGYLAMQFCLYFFVRNLIGGNGTDGGKVAQRAGMVAMAIPALTWTLFYAAEGRPYGLMLGCFAAAVLCWQIAARRTEARLLPLIGLAAALAFTLNVHFYGVLLLIPLCGAELLRTFQRRKLDPPMLAALAVGMAAILLTVPYIKASGEFKKHYYAGPVSAHMLTQPYRQMLLNYTTYPHAVQTLLQFVLVVAAIAALVSCVQLARSGRLAATQPEFAIVVLLALMPVFAFVLGKFVTHALEVRHSIGAVIGIVMVIALALTPVLRSRNAFAAVMAALLLGAVAVDLQRTSVSASDARRFKADLVLTPQQQAAVAACPDHNIYFQDLGEWEEASQYEPDPTLRAHMVLVYSLDEEMTHEQHDTMYLTAIHTQHFSTQPIASYDALRNTPGEHIFATFHSGWSWTDAAFSTEATAVQPLGKAFGGDLVDVRFK
jgi:4-amino-4-deoxy-L-arabinose transferase-like glycosyltransferase